MFHTRSDRELSGWVFFYLAGPMQGISHFIFVSG